MSTEKSKKLILLGCQLGLLITDGKQLLLCIEGKLTDVVHGRFLGLLATYTAKDSLYTEHQFLHRERLGDIIVSTYLEAFQNILLQSLGSKEYDWQICRLLANLLSQGKAILLRHHHIEYGNIILVLGELLEACLTVRAQCCSKALGLQILTKQHTQILIILAKQDFYCLFHILIIFTC